MLPAVGHSSCVEQHAPRAAALLPLPRHPLTQAPEVLGGARHSAASDVYSFGLVGARDKSRCCSSCPLGGAGKGAAKAQARTATLPPTHPPTHPPTTQVLWELLAWRLPWAGAGLNFFQLAQAVVRGERPPVPPRQQLPGPGAAAFAGLDDYCVLMRCVGGWGALAGWWVGWAAGRPADAAAAARTGHRRSHVMSPIFLPMLTHPHCSECWAHDPSQRPGFAAIVPRLAALRASMEGGDGGSGAAPTAAPALL